MPEERSIPDPGETRRQLGDACPPLPLPTVPFRPHGLLSELPPPPNGRSGWPWNVETAATDNPDLPLISVVTPSFQQGRFLEETIRSVLLQNYPKLEYIVADGGSDDETMVVLEKYRPWLSFVRSAPDRGQGHAINIGFSLSSGELRGWLNSDDIYLPGALAAVGKRASRSRADFFYGDGVTLDDERRRRTYEPAQWVLSRYLRFGGLVFSHAAFWRARIHKPIWEELHCNVDGELWQRLLPGRKFTYIPRALGAIRRQPDAKTVNPRFKEAWAEDDRLIWSFHGKPPAARTYLRCEYRIVQRFLRLLRCRIKKKRLAPLRLCAWPELPEFYP